MEKERYILSIDSGGSGIRALLVDRQGKVVAKEFGATPPLKPEEGAVEYDPRQLWDVCLKVCRDLLTARNLTAENIAAIGIANQRSSFCIWDRKSGEPLTNFISWQDIRAAGTLAGMNRNLRWRALKFAAALISRLINNTLLIATSMLVLTTDHTMGKVRWLFDQRPDLEEACRSGRALFGTMDTWFIYKLTGGRFHLTDYTNASSTSMFNPFDLKWNSLFCRIFRLPMAMFPEVRDTAGDFGTTDPALFGAPVPIRAAAGDQQASLFGHRCFEPGDVKASFGSGSFVCVNVGAKGKVSRRGLFPLLAWVKGGEPTYMLEGQVATAGTLIDWLGQGIGLSDTPAELDELAGQCEDSRGVYFVPTPIGIRFPYFKSRARASLLGLTLRTHRRHVARAVLEGIAFRIIDILEGVERDARTRVQEIRTDGGVSRSDVLMQSLADFSRCTVRRSSEKEMTALGAAYLAGLSAGYWKDEAELAELGEPYQEFRPVMAQAARDEKRAGWEKTLKAVLKAF